MGVVSAFVPTVLLGNCFGFALDGAFLLLVGVDALDLAQDVPVRAFVLGVDFFATTVAFGVNVAPSLADFLFLYVYGLCLTGLMVEYFAAVSLS